MTWLKACLRPPLPVRPLRAGTATAARSPMIPMTARSSTRVKAALLGSVSVNLAGLRRVLMCAGLNLRDPDRVEAGCECCFEETVMG
jgi:hypothetical protein